jgi:hypothetical protein
MENHWIKKTRTNSALCRFLIPLFIVFTLSCSQTVRGKSFEEALQQAEEGNTFLVLDISASW